MRRSFQKQFNLLIRARGLVDLLDRKKEVFTHAYTHTHLYIYIYIYIYARSTKSSPRKIDIKWISTQFKKKKKNRERERDHFVSKRLRLKEKDKLTTSFRVLITGLSDWDWAIRANLTRAGSAPSGFISAVDQPSLDIPSKWKKCFFYIRVRFGWSFHKRYPQLSC